MFGIQLTRQIFSLLVGWNSRMPKLVQKWMEIVYKGEIFNKSGIEVASMHYFVLYYISNFEPMSQPSKN